MTEDKTSASGVGGRRSRDAILDGPLQSTLLRLTWPMAASTLLGEAQGVISTFWIGHLIGVHGLSALAVLNPVLMALGLLSGAIPLGVQVLAARSAGSQDGTAVPIIVNGVYLAVAWGLLVTILGLSQLGPITRELAPSLEAAHNLQSYLVPWLLFYAIPMASGVLMFAVGATGWTRFGLIQSVISIGLMLALMPVFVHVFHLGFAGVALSDVCSDAMLLALTFFALYKFRNDLGLGSWGREHWRLEARWWRKILDVGLPYQLSRGADAVVQIVLVRILMEAGDDAGLAGYGVSMLVFVLAISTVGSLGGAAAIMIGQNVGAGNVERAKACLRLAITWIAGLGVGLLVILTFVPEPVFRVFSPDETVVERAVEAASVLKWAIPAAMLSGLLLRSYTAVARNRLGNAVSAGAAVVTIGVAVAWPGTALLSVTIALVISMNFRLVLLALLYRRYFSAAVARKLAAS